MGGEDETARAVLGTAGLFGGTVILLLAAVHSLHGLPFAMPRSWYVNHPLWVLMGTAFLVIGGGLLRSRQTSEERPRPWRPSRPGVRFRRVIVYSRVNCHLCEEAKELLGEYGRYLPIVEEIDIDEDPVLRERFTTSVPVVEIDGKIRFRGRISERLLRRLIEGTPPLA